jgi:hypothetical protein
VAVLDLDGGECAAEPIRVPAGMRISSMGRRRAGHGIDVVSVGLAATMKFSSPSRAALHSSSALQTGPAHLDCGARLRPSGAEGEPDEAVISGSPESEGDR